MKLELELSEWGCDDSLRLAYWDSLHGDDRFFRLNPDGTIDRRIASDDENAPEQWERVNAHDALRALLGEAWQASVEEQIRWQERRAALKNGG